MVIKLYSVLSIGLEAQLIEIEVSKSKGIPGIVIVGLSTKQAEAIRHKVIHLVQYLGYRLPSTRFIVNIAPGEITKNSTQFELPVLVGILHILGVIKELPSNTAWVGELSLEGNPSLHSGVVRLALAAGKFGLSSLIVPTSVYSQLVPFTGILQVKITTITTILELITTQKVVRTASTPQELTADTTESQHTASRDLLAVWQSIKGQYHVKRALQVAAAGRHNILLIGPPGVGKTALARCLPLFFSKLEIHQQLESTVLHQEVGFHLREPVSYPPFRSPHHTTTVSALLGGGVPPKPGELSLAHHGVLFLDELGEWPTHILEALRQPLEDKAVHLAKGKFRCTFPANSMVIAASNPCPCGYYGSNNKKCRCTPIERSRYRQKFSGPLLDRFDMIIGVPSPQSNTLPTTESPLPTPPKIPPPKPIMLCTPTATALLNTASERYAFSARVTNKMINVSHTIAHLEHVSTAIRQNSQSSTTETISITEQHVSEALSFRPQLAFLEK